MMLAHHVFPISEVAGCARQSSSEDRAAGGNAAPRSTIDPSDRIVRVSERQSSADGVCYCEAFCCMHVCVNVSSPGDVCLWLCGDRVGLGVCRRVVGRAWAPARIAPGARPAGAHGGTNAKPNVISKRPERERTLTLTIAISDLGFAITGSGTEIWRRGRLTVTPGRWAHCAPGPG